DGWQESVLTLGVAALGRIMSLSCRVRANGVNCRVVVELASSPKWKGISASSHRVRAVPTGEFEALAAESVLFMAGSQKLATKHALARANGTIFQFYPCPGLSTSAFSIPTLRPRCTRHQ